MNLFEQFEQATGGQKPLADRLRPQAMEEFLGQEAVWNKNAQLFAGLKKGEFPNLILWGPPGCGKTSLARMLKSYFKGRFAARNAVDTGAKDLRELGLESRQWLGVHAEPTLVFIDEIHRLNKAQQDVLLPHIEAGDFKLIGATTENPSYSLSSALLSRCKLVVFERLDYASLESLMVRVSQHFNMSLEQVVSPPAKQWIIDFSDGDGRRLIQAMEEVISVCTQKNAPLELAEVQNNLGERNPRYDRAGDEHYDLISAFIKSVRGSEPDAAIYWLARMIKGGEDPLFIARRLIILASEDIGNADPRALTMSVNGAQAVEMIGLPEAGITLAQVTNYLACCPKSNRSYQSWQAAQSEVDRSGSLPVPLHLRSSRKKEMRTLGYGINYKYPHDYPRGWVEQSYLPDEMSQTQMQFYDPAEHGFEKSIREYLKWMRQT